MLLVMNSGFQGRVGWRIVLMKEHCGACSDFLSRSPANSITDRSGVCELMDCFAMSFMDEFSNIFNIFCGFAGVWSP
jgi:hypothetical protein